VQRRVGGGAGEVAGEPQDDAGEDDADENREAGHESRVRQDGQAGCMTAELCTDPGDAAERVRQIGERGNRRQQHADDGREVEAAVDRRQPRLVAPDPGDEDPHGRHQGPDGCDQEWEHQALLAERRTAQDERRHQRDGVRLEQVGRHPGAVAHVVPDVVCDRRRVARVVLRDALLDLSDEVCADVRRLGEDAAAHPHEHCQQCSAEPEALEDAGGSRAEDQSNDGGTEQPEADDAHTDHAAGAEGDLRAERPPVRLVRGGGDTDVGARGEPHAEEADRGGEPGPDQEEHRTTYLHPRLARQEPEQGEDQHGEQGQGAELAAEVRGGPLLNGLRDRPHRRGSVVGTQNLAKQDAGHAEGENSHHGDHGHDHGAAGGEGRRVQR